MSFSTLDAAFARGLISDEIRNRRIFNPAAKSAGLIQSANFTCADGFTMSVQASQYHYCTPRNAEGPWNNVEVGFPSEREELLMPYIDGDGEPTQNVYAQVPVSVIYQIIRLHGGLLPQQN